MCTYIHIFTCIDRIEEADVKTQTDAFLDRPPTPLFVPAKTGQDAATQIEEGDVRETNNLVYNIFMLIGSFHSFLTSTLK